MNRSVIRHVTGRILMLLGALMLAPLAVAFFYGEPFRQKLSYAIPIAAAELLGLLLAFRRPASLHFYAREGLVICALVWILMSLLGGLPLFLSGEYPTFVDAFFEISSGFTTTGASVMRNVEGLYHSTLFWRSFTHLIGGMGVLVFALALLPKGDSEGVYILKAEMPGPMFGKVVSGLKSTARLLYAIYLIMTAVLIGVLLWAGMPPFDAVCHAFGAAGTGGFGIKNTSVAYYDNASVDYILAVAMLLFGVNFNLYYLLLLRKVKAFFRDEELRWYFAIAAVAVGLICLNVRPLYDNVGRMVRDVFFTVSSIMTTTGYSTADFGLWPVFSHTVLLLLMFGGAMAGSTAGGLKVSRVAIYSKMSRAELRRQREPGRVVPVLFNGKAVSREGQAHLMGYLIAYVVLFFSLVLITSLDAPDFLTAFSAVAATFNNIGPGLGVVGPVGNYADFSLFTKIMLSLGMIAGRLEIWPVVILFSRRSWHRT
jgi:trk system potassium uptake protein TrkH